MSIAILTSVIRREYYCETVNLLPADQNWLQPSRREVEKLKEAKQSRLSITLQRTAMEGTTIHDKQ